MGQPVPPQPPIGYPLRSMQTRWDFQFGKKWSGFRCRICSNVFVTDERADVTPARVATTRLRVTQTKDNYITTPFSCQFRRQCMQFGNSAGNFGGSALRRMFGHDSACGLSNLVALLPNSMQIVHNWSEKGVEPRSQEHIGLEPFKRTTLSRARPGV